MKSLDWFAAQVNWCREPCTANFIFYNNNSFFLCFSLADRELVAENLFINYVLTTKCSYYDIIRPIKLSQCAKYIAIVLPFVSYWNIKYKPINVAITNGNSHSVKYRVSTLNTYNFLYFAYFWENLWKKFYGFELRCFLKVFYTKNVYRYAKILILFTFLYVHFTCVWPGLICQQDVV